MSPKREHEGISAQSLIYGESVNPFAVAAVCPQSSGASSGSGSAGDRPGQQRQSVVVPLQAVTDDPVRVPHGDALVAHPLGGRFDRPSISYTKKRFHGDESFEHHGGELEHMQTAVASDLVSERALASSQEKSDNVDSDSWYLVLRSVERYTYLSLILQVPRLMANLCAVGVTKNGSVTSCIVYPLRIQRRSVECVFRSIAKRIAKHR